MKQLFAPPSSLLIAGRSKEKRKPSPKSHQLFRFFPLDMKEDVFMLTGLFKEKYPQGIIGKTKKAAVVFEKRFRKTRQIKHFS